MLFHHRVPISLRRSSNVGAKRNSERPALYSVTVTQETNDLAALFLQGCNFAWHSDRTQGPNLLETPLQDTIMFLHSP